jgi:hypothetical protein
MSQGFVNTLLCVRLCMGMEEYTPNCARLLVRKKYSTFSTERIVALRSVNIFFQKATISKLQME